MPLEHSSSPAAFKRNVSTLMHEVGQSPHVQSPQQALAIAYATKRRGAHRDAGGAAGRSTAVQDIINALQQGAAAYGGPSNATNPMGNAPTSAPAPANAPNPNSQMPMPTGLAAGAAPMAATTAGSQAPLTNTGIGSVVGGPQMILQPGGLASTQQRPQGLAFGGTPNPPWFVRNEQRQMMHTGPVMSAVPGRTDRHPVDVPSSSYVVPSDVVSHLGENNSLAGMKVLNRMFNMGPYGASIPRMGHGMGLPRPPRPPSFADGGHGTDTWLHSMTDKGGARGTRSRMGEPTPVVVAGGEHIIPPDKLMEFFKSTNMKHIHNIMDKWMLDVRKQHIKKLRSLPGPAKA